jgi:secernin
LPFFVCWSQAGQVLTALMFRAPDDMCDTLVVVQKDRVLFAKNSDRDPNEAQVLDWQPRRENPAGTTLRCTWIEIPQVRTTHAVLLSRPFWIWGAEMGANEHGVVIGNEAVFTRAPYAKTGLTGMDLLRLALERAANAQAAADVIVGLLETHGQGGGCGHENRRFTYHNSFLIADPTRAIVLETAGRAWATQDVRGPRSISNVLSIPGFAKRHSDRVKTWAAAGRLRRSRTECLAQQANKPAELAAILRDHGDRQTDPRFSFFHGGLTAPCVHAGGLIASSQTTGSWISELSPTVIRHWATGTAAPCMSIFKPVAVNEVLDVGAPTDRFDETSLWWRGEQVHRRIIGNPAALLPRLAVERLPLETSWFADPPDSKEAFRLAAQMNERWIEAAASQSGFVDGRPWFVRSYWRKRNARAAFPTASWHARCLVPTA